MHLNTINVIRCHIRLIADLIGLNRNLVVTDSGIVSKHRVVPSLYFDLLPELWVDFKFVLFFYLEGFLLITSLALSF